MFDRQKSAENIVPMILDVHSLLLETGKNLSMNLKSDHASNPPELSDPLGISELRKEAALSLGIILPLIKIRENTSLNPNDFAIKIREVMVHKGSVRGFSSREAIRAYIKERLSVVIHQYAYEFLGSEEVQMLLDHLCKAYPKVVQDVYPSLLSLSEIQRVLQNLLREGVPIRDLVKILEVLAAYAVHTKDPEILTEYVRHSMPRVLGGLYQEGFVIKAYVLEDKIEQWIAGAVRWENQVYLDFRPEIGKKILKALGKRFHLSRAKAGTTVLLVSPEIRRFVKMLTERSLPHVPVLSYNEIAPEYKVRILGAVRSEPFKEKIRKIFNLLGRGKRAETFPGDNVQKAILILNMLGSSSAQVGQYLSPWEREALTARSLIAPIPTEGKEQVIGEFLSHLPAEKKVTGVESLSKLAGQEPQVVASALQKNWLSHLSGQDAESYSHWNLDSESGGRDETNPGEKAAIFITSAARWIQDEVYRFLHLEELRELGYSMLQFPFISPDGKRKAWEDYEGSLYKDEWWDPDTLVRFIRSSIKGNIEEFKKRGFRQTQKLAILLLSLPVPVAERIGKEVLDSLSKTELQQLLGEMGQWRDHLPSEARFSVVQEFLDYAASRQNVDFLFCQAQLRGEVERIGLRDKKGAAAVIRDLWLALRDPRAVLESFSLRSPGRVSGMLISYLHSKEGERSLTSGKKASYFLSSLDPEIRTEIMKELSQQEKELFENQVPPRPVQERLFQEFLRAYYGGGYSNPIPFVKLN